MVKNKKAVFLHCICILNSNCVTQMEVTVLHFNSPLHFSTLATQHRRLLAILFDTVRHNEKQQPIIIVLLNG